MLSTLTTPTPMSHLASQLENSTSAWPTLIQMGSFTVIWSEDAWALETLTMQPRLDSSVHRTATAIIITEALLTSGWTCGQTNNKFQLESPKMDTSFGALIKTMGKFTSHANWISAMDSMSIITTDMPCQPHSLIPLGASWEPIPQLASHPNAQLIPTIAQQQHHDHLSID